jgi:hypothetical protein
MTPRIIDQLFSEFILHQSNRKSELLNLSQDAFPLEFLHPQMIRAMLAFLDNPLQEPPSITLSDWHFGCYPDTASAQTAYNLPAFSCWPHEMFKFIKSTEDTRLFSLGQFGSFLLSRKPLNLSLNSGLHHHLLPSFIQYALSTELWGEQGKWTRFHARLHELFSKHNLLNGQDFPGYYPLKAEVKKLEKLQVTGKTVHESYTLTLPWTFSLTALEKVEKIIHQEF